VDVDTREFLLLGDGGLQMPLQDALAATTALPVYYPPAEVGGRRLADGGLRAVLPLDAAAGFEADLVVAVDVGPGFDEPQPEHPVRAPALLLAHDMGEGALMAQQAQDTLLRWRATPGRPRLIHVRPPLPRRATFAAELFGEFEQAGYDTPVPRFAGGPPWLTNRGSSRWTRRTGAPAVRPIVRDLMAEHAAWRQAVERFELAVAADPGTPGDESAEEPPALLAARLAAEAHAFRIQELMAELTGLGCLFKGFDAGLVDFLSLRDDRPVYLCWRHGEDRVSHWHDIDGGFAGRHPIDAHLFSETT
jgi:hypothetical protein